ncbi:TRAP transporter substrate-binding protein [Salibacterium halotolerans]|uniref:Tripartite ATP-independent transporter solute receptor, DctP family n=1 Tax=Salibacterium halotolerans TaxID=1884432 RepID=A0A1I5XAD2_9BACI|nr:TRAP transporter substrate-binding protein [Salibacterium halotolerans]SFQ28939.1 tripartite ATP-independent transporter solute receptor, DctP family [Salibacterium halotolerans]
MKKYIKAIGMGSLLLFGAACGNSGGETSGSSGESSGSGSSSGSEQNLRLAHNLGEDHPVHKGLVDFKERVEENSDNMSVQIFPNGTLGSENEVLEQVQNGGIDMTKVSAGALENFASEYAVFSLPYIFEDQEHFYKSMESDAVQELYQSTEDQGFVGLTYYDSGARSFYTKDTPIKHPDDLQGLKIRVMDSQTQIDMVEQMGGSPTPMPYGDIYTGLQQGVIDGAESNPTALTNGNHGEVAKTFSYDQHTRIPDIVVMSADTWNGLSSEQQDIIKTAAEQSTETQKEIWAETVEEAKAQAKEMGVEFYEVDKEPFRKAVQPMIEEYRQDEAVANLLDEFEALRE